MGNDLPVKLAAVRAAIKLGEYNNLKLSDYRSSNVQKWVGEKDAGSAIGGAQI